MIKRPGETAVESAVARLDGFLDWLPWVWREQGRWKFYRHGQLGCNLRIYSRYLNRGHNEKP